MEHVKMFCVEIQAGDLIGVARSSGRIRVGTEPGARPIVDLFSQGTADHEFEFGGELPIFAQVCRWRHSYREADCASVHCSRGAGPPGRPKPGAPPGGPPRNGERSRLIPARSCSSVSKPLRSVFHASNHLAKPWVNSSCEIVPSWLTSSAAIKALPRNIPGPNPPGPPRPPRPPGPPKPKSPMVSPSDFPLNWSATDCARALTKPLIGLAD